MGTDSTTSTSPSAEPAASCGCPRDNGLIRHQRGICTDPVVEQLGWYYSTIGTSRLTEMDKLIIRHARDLGPELRAAASDRDRLAGWLLAELADRLEQLADV
jgi:hypothetical protein